MPAKRIAQTIVVCLTVLYLHLTLPAIVFAQAWTPPQGDGTVSLSYQTLSFKGHFDPAGHKERAGASRALLAILELEYGLTDKMALDFRLPYVASRYTDTRPSSAELRGLFDAVQQQVKGNTLKFLDDGTYTATFQDFRVGLRYNLLTHPLVLTPFVEVTIPSHDYQIVGESAPGRNLRELQIGANAGRRLNPILPKLYVQGRYAYAFVQRSLGVPLNRSNADLELGYIFNRSFSFRALGSWQRTHGGLRFDPHGGLNANPNLTPLQFLTHDRLLQSNHWHFGGAGTFALTRSVAVNAGVVTFLSGANTHYGTGITIGMSWSFSRGLALTTNKTDSPPRMLAAFNSPYR